jgi:hypothetical protein
VLNWQFLELNPDGGTDVENGAQQRYEF